VLILIGPLRFIHVERSADSITMPMRMADEILTISFVTFFVSSQPPHPQDYFHTPSVSASSNQPMAFNQRQCHFHHSRPHLAQSAPHLPLPHHFHLLHRTLLLLLDPSLTIMLSRCHSALPLLPRRAALRLHRTCSLQMHCCLVLHHFL
jgi:hypothetical protein